MHLYTEKNEDVVSKQLHPNGALYLYIVLKEGKPANGWSNKVFYENGDLQQEQNYSNGLLIEKIHYDESSVITEHKIWNNRLKQLIDKPVHPKFSKPNVITGLCYLCDCIPHLPAISEFIGAAYDKNSLPQTNDAFRKAAQEQATWTMTGKQMRFIIYLEEWEGLFKWCCHCDTEELYWKARVFLKGKL